MTRDGGEHVARVNRALTVCLVAGEESGDRLGAALMRALAHLSRRGVQFSGVGGAQMAAEGLVSLFPIDELAIMGFAAIPRRLPAILRRIGSTADAILAARPDTLVIIDSPDFTHRVARRVRRADPGIPIIDYVSPSVWAWRPGRASAMRGYVDQLLAILPFEPAVHQRLGGPPCSYVGHPLAERIDELRPSAEDAIRRLTDPPLVLVLPGSRSSEVRRLIEPFAQAIAIVARRAGPIELVLPTITPLMKSLKQVTASWPVRPRIIVDAGEKLAAFRRARAALAASGTVTLELALAAVPMVAAYRVAGWEAIILRRLIRVPTVILANLILGENVIPEFLQENCVPHRLAEALVPLLFDSEERRAQLAAFSRLEAAMQLAVSPSERAARIVFSTACATRLKRRGSLE
jgi:lipid-A-disaccharide synthase